MLDTIIKGIDASIDREGRFSSFIILPLALIVLYEVIMRYIFNAPTTWGFEATAFAYGIHYMLGLSFMENAQGHVRVDIVIMRFPKKVQAAIMFITYLLIFMPVYGLMTYGAAKYAYTSTLNGELNSTSWAPPIWPIKILMAVGFLLLFIQGLSTMLKHLRTMTAKEEPYTKIEKSEVNP